MHETLPQTPAGRGSHLYVVTAITNPARYASRYRLYRDFERMVANAGATLYTVETAFGSRPYAVTEAGDPRHVRLRTACELWHKENMLNLGVSRLPADWEYAAWVDADVAFARPDWVRETLNQLQHHPVVQLFSRVQDLSPAYEPFNDAQGFAAQLREKGLAEGRFAHGRCGYGWAIRRETFDRLGGLIDFGILGGGDKHMALSFVGRVQDSHDPGISAGYRRELAAWQARAAAAVGGDLGFVPGVAYHYWHGRKSRRQYVTRWELLVKHRYDPRRDLVRDWQGLYRLTDRCPPLREGLWRYFSQRNEDGLDMDPAKPQEK